MKPIIDGKPGIPVRLEGGAHHNRWVLVNPKLYQRETSSVYAATDFPVKVLKYIRRTDPLADRGEWPKYWNEGATHAIMVQYHPTGQPVGNFGGMPITLQKGLFDGYDIIIPRSIWGINSLLRISSPDFPDTFEIYLGVAVLGGDTGARVEFFEYNYVVRGARGAQKDT